MAEFDSSSLYIARTKLKNLLTQVNSASSDDLANGDVRAALGLMRDNLLQLSDNVTEAEEFSSALREGIILAATEHISLYSNVLGFVIRSSTTRNPFELYFPFRQLSKTFFPEDEVYLILSSEWNYVPFTYPLTLDELPNFILIGMPAPEADNVLAFPLAGHELGHSIWKHKGLIARFSSRAFEITRKRFEDSPELLRALYPGVSEDQFENDLFSSRLKDSAISEIITFCLKQTEEVFCDLIGVNIFGASYLHAFRYLLAPSDRGERSPSYPDLLERATIMDEYVEEMGWQDVDIARYFNKEDDISHPFYAQLVRQADLVRRELWQLLKETVADVVAGARLSHVNSDSVNRVKERFDRKLPIEIDVSLGELICGAWKIYEESFSAPMNDGRGVEAHVSNLVLKSAEAMEFKARMKHARK